MITRRNLIHIRRMPEMLLDVTIQPVMFVLLFAFVFGGAIATESPAGYNEWLLGGIMGQTIAFASFIVAVGLTSDIDKGIVDRMRSLPIHPSAVLVGRSISSLIHSSIGIVVMSLTGLRDRLADPRHLPRGGRGLRAAAALGLHDDLARHPGRLHDALGGGRQRRDVHDHLPADVPVQRVRADRADGALAAHDRRVEPDLALVQAIRVLWGNTPPAPADAALPLQHPVVATLIWCIGLTAILAPLVHPYVPQPHPAVRESTMSTPTTLLMIGTRKGLWLAHVRRRAHGRGR